MASRKPGIKPRAKPKGQALLAALLVLGIIGATVLFSYFSPSTTALESDQKTADVLAVAKAALIGRAVADGDRPGSLPCPDAVTNIAGNTPNDGVADVIAGNCPTYLGRLPWRTLGLPDLRDTSGERLWYALSPNFRDDASAQPINSNTRGTLTVYAADGTTPLSTQAVAVIFAPGVARGAQTRDSANENNAASYLDSSAGRNNATAGGPFIVGRLRDPANANYNDQVVAITAPEIFPAVEMRVAVELKSLLQAYFDAYSYYPYAAAYDDTSGNCALNLRRGRVPASTTGVPTLPNLLCAGLATWTLPAWMTSNQWHRVMYYSVAAGYSFIGTASCTPLGCLTVGANTTVPALFFTPGTPLNSAWRTTTADNDLTHYLESVSGNTQNQDGWGAGANDTYVSPASNPLDRDRIFTLSGGATPEQCTNNAAAILALAPCGQPPKLNPQCSTLTTRLAVCPCAAAAVQLINTPCQNTLNPSACQSAVSTLQGC